MKTPTKVKILNTARDLFNKEGYNRVSMRDIAAALDMSVGNLTYHFKKKEDLVEAIVLQNHMAYVIPQPASSIEELDELFKRKRVHHKDNAYYYRHYKQLSRISIIIKDVQQEATYDFYHALKKTFENLQANGLMQKESIPNQYDSLIQIIMASNVYGAPEVTGFEKRPLVETYWNVIHFFLTDKGKDDYHKMRTQNIS
jgi:AcrR family transcriptional regulator